MFKSGHVKGTGHWRIISELLTTVSDTSGAAGAPNIRHVHTRTHAHTWENDGNRLNIDVSVE